MAKYRIVERESMLYFGERVYDVEVRVWFTWVNAGLAFLTQELAEERIEALRAKEKAPAIGRIVVRTYDA